MAQPQIKTPKKITRKLSLAVGLLSFTAFKRDLTNIRPIYYRRMEMDVMTGEKRCLGFVIGFQGNESNGSNYKKEVNVL